MSVRVEVVRVFTDSTGRFGNELGLAQATEVAEADRQGLAAKAGYSETVFLGAPHDGVAPVRVFTPAVELPFAGHPTVGTAWWFAQQGTPVQALDVPAGRVAVAYADALTWVTARAAWAPDFTFHQVADVAELAALRPEKFAAGQHYFWTWVEEHRGSVRSRMFAPAMGIAEDEATGAAAVALTARLGRGLTITQGAGSQIFTEWDSDGWVRLGGRVVPETVVEL
ncbi:PhzF family phenazine biosynthesis protein [Nocardia sp. NPDC048505]|uniref:PhzF family phenazine biosynthesis protein n=1 Tax=Nocardia sp. NPDC048505 TaxID=3155756 RepID=UPI0033E9C849